MNALEIQFAKVQLPSLNFDSYGLNFDPQLVIESGMIMAIAKDLGNFNTYGVFKMGSEKSAEISKSWLPEKIHYGCDFCCFEKFCRR